MNRNTRWTQDQDELLRSLFAAQTPRRLIARRLGRSVASISARSANLGISLGGVRTPG